LSSSDVFAVFLSKGGEGAFRFLGIFDFLLIAVLFLPLIFSNK